MEFYLWGLQAHNFASSLAELKRFEEAKSFLRKIMPVARRILGEEDRVALKMRKIYAEALYRDPSATLDDLHEAVTTLEETARIVRRVFGGAHPTAVHFERELRIVRAVLRPREAPSYAVDRSR